ncbi:hypothetical protein [Micromonospora sp. NBRC 101691]|uniref:hypothetical protein n=1 Tax=Micromonospora sp. NBRC 101691 TaxID=3032198 RepID=UPI0024A44459|nr:hypothetical protein [Micromonospora sp. NBRC 101691]GLY22253.1 hypothetical protein Misp04_19850 [Micromonospora sp. NBRC 101691]
MSENRTTRRLARLALAAGAAGALLLTATPASAASPTIASNSGGANIRSCTSLSCGSNGYYGNGTTVTMVCYKDGDWVNPPNSDYSSNRWFKVNSPTTGYIHSSLVDNQVSTPRCP